MCRPAQLNQFLCFYLTGVRSVIYNTFKAGSLGQDFYFAYFALFCGYIKVGFCLTRAFRSGVYNGIMIAM
jgi:hypothetical protein